MSKFLKLLVLLLGVTIYSQDTLSVKDGAFGYNQDFKLEINLKTASDIKALQFDISFDENNFTYSSTYTLNKDRLGSESDHDITVKKVSNSKIRVLIYSPSNKFFEKTDGKLVDFDFKNSVYFGDYSFTISNVVASLIDNSSASLALENGNIRTKAPQFWKQNSEVDFGSVYKGQTVSRELFLQNSGNSDLILTLVKDSLSTFKMTDGSGNVLDWPITLTSQEESNSGNGIWSLNLVFELEAKKNGTYEELFSITTDDPLSNDTVHEFKIKAKVYNENKLVVEKSVESYNNQETKIKVSINGDEPITSFQFDISSIYNYDNNKISYIDSSAKLLDESTDHVISSKLIKDDDGNEYLRVVCYSTTNSVFNQPIGEIVEFSLKTSGLGAGLREILISNAVLTNSDLVNVTSSVENGSIYTYSPGLEFKPSAFYDIGEIKKNTNQKHDFIINNNGNLKLKISNLITSDPNLIIKNSFPIEIEQGTEKKIEFDLLPTSSKNEYSSYIVPVHNADWVSSDTLKISANIKSRNTVQLSDALLSNGVTKNISLDLLNSDNVRGLQFDLTFPKESKTINYTLTADGSTSYVFEEKNNAKNPDLVLYVGDIINFKNNTSNHPLYIVTNNDDGYDASNELAGVQNQGVTEGTLILDLSDLDTGTYYYVCGPHKSMTGKITVLPKFSLSVDKSNLNSERGSDFNVSNSILSSSSRKNRVVIYSDTNSTFVGNIGEILNIPVTVSDISETSMQIVNGSYTVNIDNIIISGKDNDNISSITETSSKIIFSTENLFEPVVNSNQSVSINENPSGNVFFYTVVASDSDDYSFINDFKIVSGNEEGSFGITNAKGELYVKTPSKIDFENKESYSLGITVTDGTKTSQEEIVVVNIINDPNVFVTEDLTVAVYRDNTKSGIVTDDYNNLNNVRSSIRSNSSEEEFTTIYTIDDGDDKDFFNISKNTGSLTFKSAPSFANPLDSNKDNIYEVTVKAQNIDDASEDVPVITSRKSISVLENNTSVASVTTIITTDSDGDGVADSDADGDGIIDTEDNCPLTFNEGQEDADGNGEGDVCQDTDGDGILDVDDICPIIANPGQEDSDDNGIGDVCEDSDGDGISDTDDNCPLVANTDQADLNNNNIGDVCELSPLAVADVLTLIEDASLTSTNVIANDTEGDGDTLSLVSFGYSGEGIVAINADELSIDYTPAANFNGTETITYTVSDGALTSTGTFTITVTSVNDAPVAVDDTLTVDEDAALTSTNVINNDTDVDVDTLSLTAVSTDGSGTVAVNADELSVDYTPAANFNGTETITYTVSDGALTSTGTFTITVSAVNDAPVAKEQSLTTEEEISLDIVLEGSDVDGDELTYEIVDNPANGSVTIDKSNVNYIPNSGYFGDDSFTFKVNDGIIDSEKATVYISVTSNDFDNDGILNADDTCPDTPEGAAVDFTGCEVFDLPKDNNKVSVMSSTCIGNTDGSIGLSVEDASYSYLVTVTGQDDPIALGGETKTASVTGLGKGTYTVCFTVEGQDGYEQCFEVNIEEPKALSAFIDVNNDTRQTSIQLSGSSTYTVDINGERYDVKGDNFKTTLKSGLSIIRISTDLECQGIIEREVFISEDILYYPNPTPGDVNVYVNGQDTKVMMTVFSAKGDLIFTRQQDIQSTRKTDLDLGGVPAGTYLVTLEGPTVRKTFKIVKR